VSQADLVVRWQDDVARIAGDVLAMHFYREIYRGVTQIAVDHGGAPSSAFFSYLTDTYGQTQLVGIRRQADTRMDTISIRRLLREIRKNPKQLTREWYSDMYGQEPGMQARAEATWNELFAGQIGEYLDPRLVRADLDDLISAAERAKHWADNRLAHHGRERVEEGPPTLDDIDRAIDTIGALFRRYNLLLRGDMFKYALTWAGMKGDLNALFSRACIR
jgi:hypothetical protein